MLLFKLEEVYGGDTRGLDITQKEIDKGEGSEEWRGAEIMFFSFYWHWFKCKCITSVILDEELNK